MKNNFKYFGKSVFGLIFFFWVLPSRGQDVLELNPDDKNIYKKVSSFLDISSSEVRVIKLAPGAYEFNRPFNLPSNVILQGDSSSNTFMVFDLGGKGNCINVVGSRKKSRKLVHLKFEKESDPLGCYKVYNASPKEVGLSKWGNESFGKIIRGDLEGDTLIMNTFLFQPEIEVLEDSIYSYEIKPVRNVTVQNLTIDRVDRTEGQTSNIFIQYAADCSVINVDSRMANYSHITIENSTGCLMLHNRFINAFSHGNGGKGYGVTLQYGATNNEVSGCVFDSLRHGVVMQLGANTNWIVENYFKNGFWEDVRLPKKAAGDIVLHGNYPYMNFVEGNICNNIVIDNSHGLNGPSNLFQFNKTLLYGFYMNKKSVDGITYVLENEIFKSGCFKGKLKFSGNYIESCGNRVNQKMKNNEGECDHASKKEYLSEKIKQSENEATQYFGITVPAN